MSFHQKTRLIGEMTRWRRTAAAKEASLGGGMADPARENESLIQRGVQVSFLWDRQWKPALYRDFTTDADFITEMQLYSGN